MPRPNPGPPLASKKIVLQVSGPTPDALDKYSVELQKVVQKYR